MRKIVPLSLSLAAIVAATAALAQNAPAPTMTRAQMEQHSGAAFGQMDANGDGVLNAADRTAMQKAMFDRMDTDHNGAISFAEFAAMHDQRRAAREQGDAPMPGMDHGDHGRDHEGGEHEHGGPDAAPNGGHMAMMAQMADTNHDGVVSRAEFTAAAMARFDKADTNKDGKLSGDEMRAGMGRMKGHMMGRMKGHPMGAMPAQNQAPASTPAPASAN